MYPVEVGVHYYPRLLCTFVQKKYCYKANMSGRSRNYCVTINNWTEDDKVRLRLLVEAGICTYLVFGEEIGEKGTPHLQGYMELANAKSKKALNKRLLNRSHLVHRKGTAAEASTYPKKECRNVEEHGEISQQGKRSDLKNVVSLVKEGKSFQEIVEITSSFQAMRMAEKCLSIFEPPRETKPYVIYCYGASGLCKTRIAYLDNPDSRIHKQPAASFKWWQGYDSQDIVIIDEFRAQIPWDRMLELLDYYPAVVENKGGSRQFKPVKIYITSPSPLSDWYNDIFEQKYQLWRRIDEVWYFEKKNLGICISKYAQTFNDEAQHWTQTFELQEEEQRLKSGEKVCSEGNAEGGDEKVDCVL